MLGCPREEGRKGALCESGERVNEEEVYSRGRRELTGAMSGGGAMERTSGHTHAHAQGSRHRASQRRAKLDPNCRVTCPLYV